MAERNILQDGFPVTRTDALAAGLRFYSGRVCKRGHAGLRYAGSRECEQCAAAWRASYAPAYRNANREALKTRARATYHAAIEKNRAALRAYKLANKERVREVHKAWREANKSTIRRYGKRYYSNNSEAILAAQKALHRLYPERANARAQKRRALIANADGTHTADDIVALFAAQRGKCGYCRTSIKAGYHIDHIQPLSKGGSNWPRNLQLLCPRCNMSKASSDPTDFARLCGLLL